MRSLRSRHACTCCGMSGQGLPVTPYVKRGALVSSLDSPPLCCTTTGRSTRLPPYIEGTTHSTDVSPRTTTLVHSCGPRLTRATSALLRPKLVPAITSRLPPTALSGVTEVTVGTPMGEKRRLRGLVWLATCTSTRLPAGQLEPYTPSQSMRVLDLHRMLLHGCPPTNTASTSACRKPKWSP